MSYGRWKDLRWKLCQSAVDYILSRERWFKKHHVASMYEEAYTQLKSLKKVKTVEFLETMDMQNLFILFNMGGIVPLMLKEDNEGFYTTGNAVDLLVAIDILFKNDALEDIKKTLLDEFKEVLRESIRKIKFITVQ
jgi:hypothetical protein